MKFTLILTSASLALSTLMACSSMPTNIAENPTLAASADKEACQVTVPFQTTAFDDDFADDMDGLMAHMMDHGIAPGAVLAINQAGETVFKRAYGFADSADAKPMTMDSLFRIYSMSKPITSIAALQLVDAGQIALDDPVSRYLPDFKTIEVAADEALTDRRAPLRAPTVRDLLRHTTGLTYRTGAKTDPVAAIYAELGIPAGPGVSDPPTNGMDPVVGNDSFIARIVQAPLKHDPGTRFTYGNSTDVLGALITAVTGQSLGDYLNASVFTPLGMNDTMFQVPEARFEDFTSVYIVPPQAPSGSPIDYTVPIDVLQPQTPHKLDGYRDSLYAETPAFEYGGAGLVSDADDYLAFTQALMNDTPRLVSPALWQEASRNQLSDEARSSAEFLSRRGFGLGFAVREATTTDEPVFPQCGLYWAGAASTYFWIDEVTDTTGVLMTQVFEGDVRSYFSEILERIYIETL